MSKPQSHELLSNDAEVQYTLKSGPTLYPEGWRCVETLEDLDDDEYYEEEEEYVILDLGATMDSRTLQTEAAYQLIGMDTGLPFLRIGENIFEGRIAPLVGDEVIFDVVRQEDDPQKARYQPILKTSRRVTMRGVTLEPRGIGREDKPAVALKRGMFPSKPRRLGPGEVGKARVRKRKGKGKEGEGEGDAEVEVEVEPEVQEPKSSPAKNAFSMYDEGTGTPRRRQSGRGVKLATYSVSTLTDLADIANAGGLGNVRLDVAEDAHPDLLEAVTSVRGGKEWTRGSTLSKAQEERLVRNLPASGPGSRGGKAGRKGMVSGSATPRRGVRPRGRGSVPASGAGLAEGFLGLGEVYTPDEDGPSEQEPQPQPQPQPMEVDQNQREISDDELREISDEELREVE